MSDKYFFLVNPVSGSGKVKKLWPAVQKSLKSNNIKFDFEESTCKGDGIRIAKNARAKNYKCYISVGGDGTFHELVNGLLLANVATLPIVFILPVGTGNDFVKTHKIPKWGKEWLQMLQAFRVKKHNAGLLYYQEDKQKKSRYFVNVAGMFYDGYIVKATTLRKTPITSSFQYLGLILKYLFKYKPPKGIIKWNEGKEIDAYYTANIGIAKYSGGGMSFVPHADPFGKTFAVTLAKKMHPIRVLFSTPYFYNGKVENHSKITCFQTANISIEPVDMEILVEVDGEFLGSAPCHVELISEAFWLVC